MVLASLLYTARNYRLSHRGQVNDRFTKALERLGSPELYVRIGGIHALGQVVKDSPDQHSNITAVLVAFIRQRTPRVAPNDTSPIYPRPALPTELAADVLAALTILSAHDRRTTGSDVRPDLSDLYLPRLRLDQGAQLGSVNLDGAELRGAYLSKAQLQYAYCFKTQLQLAIMSEAQLQNASFEDALMQGADLGHAKLHCADFRGAQMQGAKLNGAEMRGAILRGAQLQGANLINAQLQDADLRGAQMQGVNLYGAQLWNAKLEGVQLHGANLSGSDRVGPVQGLTAKHLAEAEFDENTQFPPELREVAQALAVARDGTGPTNT